MNNSSSKEPPVLAIVVPCFNEEEALPATAQALAALLSGLRADQLVSTSSYVCFVDDGSRDATWRQISSLADASADFRGLRLSRNFGHQGAVLGGMLECDADIVVTIDADLQDDERCIADMVKEYHKGCEVVLGVRSDRSSDTFGKRLTAQLYYRLLAWLGVRVVFNHADYRLLSRRAVDLLREYSEANLYLRGVIPLLGLRSSIVYYARRERVAGESKYPLRKMLSLAWDGVTSFSVSPLRLVSGIGISISLAALLVTLWAFFVRFLVKGVVPGWASTVVPIYFLGGVQILCLGIIGEYVGKIYMETKRRPRYLIETYVGRDSGWVRPSRTGHSQVP
jgi:glycosyltransferase involved in cell wall biosynthesis